ncbi:MAG TPA: hypothetical protein VLA76_06875 [Candidatus Angelobacter sp.]|nr:hypothetical protein [Candidatus Angelobacter sp.]
MRIESPALRVRVILVTTRAALRHAPADDAQRRAIVGRGRALVDGLAQELNGQLHNGELDDAYAELDALERG